MVYKLNKDWCHLANKLSHNGELVTGGNHDYIQLTNQSLEHNWDQGFPLLTQRRIHFEAAKAEVLWMLKGNRPVQDLAPYEHFWKPWANTHGYIPSSYGRFMVDYPSIPRANLKRGEAGECNPVDQIEYITRLLQVAPHSRRAVVSLWHPDNAINSSQPPCHVDLCFNRSRGHLDLMVTARSQDIILGLPYDLCNYGLIQLGIALQLNMVPGKLTMAMANCHMYQDNLYELLDCETDILTDVCTNERTSYSYVPSESLEAIINSIGVEPGHLNRYHKVPRLELKVNDTIEGLL